MPGAFLVGFLYTPGNRASRLSLNINLFFGRGATNVYGASDGKMLSEYFTLGPP